MNKLGIMRGLIVVLFTLGATLNLKAQTSDVKSGLIEVAFDVDYKVVDFEDSCKSLEHVKFIKAIDKKSFLVQMLEKNNYDVAIDELTKKFSNATSVRKFDKAVTSDH